MAFHLRIGSNVSASARLSESPCSGEESLRIRRVGVGDERGMRMRLRRSVERLPEMPKAERAVVGNAEKTRKKPHAMPSARQSAIQANLRCERSRTMQRFFVTQPPQSSSSRDGFVRWIDAVSRNRMPQNLQANRPADVGGITCRAATAVRTSKASKRAVARITRWNS